MFCYPFYGIAVSSCRMSSFLFKYEFIKNNNGKKPVKLSLFLSPFKWYLIIEQKNWKVKLLKSTYNKLKFKTLYKES